MGLSFEGPKKMADKDQSIVACRVFGARSTREDGLCVWISGYIRSCEWLLIALEK